jgi:hypothetical protein
MNLIRRSLDGCVSPKGPEAGCRNLKAGGAWSDQVATAYEFYDYADEHLAWAETAKTERERAIFLQMAVAWLEVAQQSEVGARAEEE